MIKSRIIQVLELKGIPKEKFYQDIGMTSANFRGKAKETPLNSLAIENIFSIIPDLNLEWLITGKGDMLKHKSYDTSREGMTAEPLPAYGKPTNNDTIEVQNKLIAMQEKEIARLEKELSDIKSSNPEDRKDKVTTTARVALSKT